MARRTTKSQPLLPVARSATEEILQLAELLRRHIAENSTDIEISLVSRGILTRIAQLANVAWSAVERPDAKDDDEVTLLRDLGGWLI